MLITSPVVFTGVADANGLDGTKLCYYDMGSSKLKYAKADAIATSRKVIGVTLIAAAGNSNVTLIRKGLARITAEVGCVPKIGAEAYLSGSIEGCVSSALSGTAYPRQVGYFFENEVDSEGTVLVDMFLDEARDDERIWTFSDETIHGPTSRVSYGVTRALWRELEMDVRHIGAADSDYFINYPHDHTIGVGLDSDGGSQQWGDDQGSCLITQATAMWGSLLVVDKWIEQTLWQAEITALTSFAEMGIHAFVGSYVNSPDDTLVLSSDGNVFVEGTHITCKGAVRLT